MRLIDADALAEKKFQERECNGLGEGPAYRQGWNDAIDAVMDNEPSAQPEVIHCCDCIYYDPEHIEKNGVRYEYKDMTKDAFDILGTGLVTSEYGINVGGRCCRDYNVGYSEDKRVFVSKQNYCGRAWRRQDEQ